MALWRHCWLSRWQRRVRFGVKCMHGISASIHILFGLFSWLFYILCYKRNWRVTHICVSNQTIIGSDNGLSPGRRQAIIRTNAGILLIESLGTNYNEILIDIHIFSFKKIHFKMSSGKWRPFCLGLNVLRKVTWVLRRSEALRAVPWLRPCTPIRLMQGLRPRNKPVYLWSPQYADSHS